MLNLGAKTFLFLYYAVQNFLAHLLVYNLQLFVTQWKSGRNVSNPMEHTLNNFV